MLDTVFDKFSVIKPWAGAEGRRRFAVVSMELVPETRCIIIARAGFNRASTGKVLSQDDVAQKVVSLIVQEHLNKTSFEYMANVLKGSFNANTSKRRLAEMEILLVEDGFNQFNKKGKKTVKPRELSFVTA